MKGNTSEKNNVLENTFKITNNSYYAHDFQGKYVSNVDSVI